MRQRIINDLKNVTIGGCYVGRISIQNNYFDQQAQKDVQQGNDKTIFLSYNWHDGDIADRIDGYLSELPGITVKRDVRDIGAWKSIREFMEGIRQQDYAVLIVSDSYLKSKNCMFEATEMMKEREYVDRIFPAVVEKGIYDPLVRAEYIRYWQQEGDKLEAAIRGLDPAYATGLVEDLKCYKSIASSVGEFLSIVADRNNPDIQGVEVQVGKAVLRKEYPSTAVSYDNLALVYKAQGEYEKAKLLYEKSLRIREKILGEEHLDTATSYNNLAGVYETQGEYEKAKLLYEKSLRIREKVLGEEHPSTATSYNNLAGMYEEHGEYEKAELLYEKSLRIRERVLGEDHPDVAVSYNNLAAVYETQGEYEKTINYYLKAYNIFLLRLGFDHPNAQIALENMKIVFLKWNPAGDFEQWLEEQMKE